MNVLVFNYILIIEYIIYVGHRLMHIVVVDLFVEQQQCPNDARFSFGINGTRAPTAK